VSKPLLALVLTLLCPLSGAGQKPVPTPPADVLLASPGNFRLLLDNEYVRVIEYSVRPGERDQWHTHPAKVSYVAEGGTLRVNTEDGKSFVAEEKAGETTWDPPVGRHFVENVGKTPVRIILTEVKGVRAGK
jgi:quercetin dioxygenase-like cupin family protein